MSTYKGKTAIVDMPADHLFSRFSDLTIFEERINSLPEAERARFSGVEFTPDSITIPNPQIGQMTLQVIERIPPKKVVFGAVGAPIKLEMIINIEPLDEQKSEVGAQIDVDLPMMIRPFVGPKLQEAADKFSEMIINFAR